MRELPRYSLSAYQKWMNDARIHLAEWFEEFWGEKLPADGDANLFDRFGIDGDDASDFIEGFTAHFGVNADSYRWYFHHGDEGTNFGGMFFRPIYKRVKRLPITPDLLVEAIDTRAWPLRYPTHELPSVRWDIRINQFLLVIPVVLLALWLWKLMV